MGIIGQHKQDQTSGVGAEVLFVTDSMLGKLARWLRALGYDTHYESHWEPGIIDRHVKEGRRLITRQKMRAEEFRDSLLVNSDHVGEQLTELKWMVPLSPDRSDLFSRCLLCNAPLRSIKVEEARDNLPEYVFYQNMGGIRFCPSCGRYYWPGTHRTRMARQLEDWGFMDRPKK